MVLSHTKLARSLPCRLITTESGQLFRAFYSFLTLNELIFGAAIGLRTIRRLKAVGFLQAFVESQVLLS